MIAIRGHSSFGGGALALAALLAVSAAPADAKARRHHRRDAIIMRLPPSPRRLSRSIPLLRLQPIRASASG